MAPFVGPVGAAVSAAAVFTLFAWGTEVVGNAPAEFSTGVRKEFEKWRTLVQRAGLKV